MTTAKTTLSGAPLEPEYNTVDDLPETLFEDADMADWAQEDGIVKVKLVGACSGCAMSMITLKNAIEDTIKKEIPEVKAVESV